MSSMGGGIAKTTPADVVAAAVDRRRPRWPHNPEMEQQPYVAPAVAELFIPEDKRLSLLQLTEATCKWPIGDPLSKDFYFCGQHSLESAPYCDFHSRRAYHQVDKKRR